MMRYTKLRLKSEILVDGRRQCCPPNSHRKSFFSLVLGYWTHRIFQSDNFSIDRQKLVPIMNIKMNGFVWESSVPNR